MGGFDANSIPFIAESFFGLSTDALPLAWTGSAAITSMSKTSKHEYFNIPFVFMITQDRPPHLSIHPIVANSVAS
jgi:hypothetical protein